MFENKNHYPLAFGVTTYATYTGLGEKFVPFLLSFFFFHYIIAVVINERVDGPLVTLLK